MNKYLQSFRRTPQGNVKLYILFSRFLCVLSFSPFSTHAKVEEMTAKSSHGVKVWWWRKRPWTKLFLFLFDFRFKRVNRFSTTTLVLISWKMLSWLVLFKVRWLGISSTKWNAMVSFRKNCICSKIRFKSQNEQVWQMFKRGKQFEL